METPRRHVLILTALGALTGAGVAFLAIRLALVAPVEKALRDAAPDRRPLSFHAVAPADPDVKRIGSGEIHSVAFANGGLWRAGASGVALGDADDGDGGLPTLRASALASWRGEPVVGLEAGGLYRRRGVTWEEARSGWGALHVRALVETEGGELLVGAREGLFRAAYGDPSLARLDSHPVRSLAEVRGVVFAGGEDGLRRIVPSAAVAIPTREPWIESVGLMGDRLFVATPAGLLAGPLAGPLEPVSGGEEVATGVAAHDAFWGVAWPPAATIARVGDDGIHEERLPARVLRVMTAAGTLFADTERGLYRRDASGWTLVRTRHTGLPPGASHLSALAAFQGGIAAGVFDGGLVVSPHPDGATDWRSVSGSEAWGVNALLPAGGVLYLATLRGAARFDGIALSAIDGPGAAFSLAATNAGVAIGYGQGVRIAGDRLLSAFHGLPGNQALALAAGDDLYVGTPSGLGGVRGTRVAWRVAAGEARLPHPWVTALLKGDEVLYVGTYGGGVARRIAAASTGPRPAAFADKAHYEAFAETEGLKINTGCLVRSGGRILAGTDGQGLWRLRQDGSGFERLHVTLPSPRVTALLATDNGLFVGTDEGLARLPPGGTR
jgi:hypothetical protein